MGCGGNECACGECEDIWESKFRYINNLCNKIEELGFHFADNHIGNLGYVKRKGRRKLVCIDTGAESFSSIANAWGFGKPGPKCDYCSRYQCRCNDSYWCD